ncbi:hypothetical protein THIOM_004238 [Candidatus Thiomargarita nelsonii]|uniref:Uncharacterized protein n=1 Tax=Candidatus Thiomargarita nelsonii TaxID=1003181 RepID=A0A176RWC4_9GAMM|nr:hypothetical protein THIOM_004238 [Candidatus Thiomargarita nelsonii]
MIDDLFVTDMNLSLANKGRYGDHDGKLFWIAFEIVCHCHHRFVIVTDNHDL